MAKKGIYFNHFNHFKQIDKLLEVVRMSNEDGGRLLVRDYCTTREAASALGIAMRTAQMWVDSGILKAWKTEGGHRRISLDSVKSLMDARSGSPTFASAGSVSVAEIGERLRVLVVEDDNVLLKLYRMRIAAWNLPIDVTTASNACEGLILIGREEPDLLICDLRMPGVDGFQMLRTLSASSFKEGLEIVVVSGLGEEQVSAGGGLPSGVQLLPKPVPFGKLKEITESLLARRAKLSHT